MNNKPNSNNDKFFIKLVQENILKVYKDGRVKNLKTGNYIGSRTKDGYIQIGYKKNNKVIHILVHRLVYIVFKYKMKPPSFIINHKDGNKSNNYYRNLERSNNSHNVQHAYDTGLKSISNETKKTLSKLYSGSKSLTAKLTYNQSVQIKKLYKTGKHTHQSLGIKFGVHRSTIGLILRNKTFIHPE